MAVLQLAFQRESSPNFPMKQNSEKKTAPLAPPVCTAYPVVHCIRDKHGLTGNLLTRFQLSF